MRYLPLLVVFATGCNGIAKFTIDGSSTATVPQGTLVEVFPAAGCHNFMSRAELEGQFITSGDIPSIYAVYRSSAQHPRVSRLLAGTLGIILDRGASGQIFAVSGDKIVSADFGCGIPPRDLAALVPSDTFLVAPPSR